MEPEPKQTGSLPLGVRGCILAGGVGRRLGEPKATALLAGRPLVGYALEAFSGAGLRPAIAAKAETHLPELDADVEVWRDSADVAHPLAGVVEAVRRVEDGAVVVCPCDLPFVPADLLGWLASLDEPLAVVASQPLLGRYAGGLAPALGEALAVGRSVQATVAALGARMIRNEEVARFGDPELLLANVNTRADLELAERLILEGRAS